MSSLTQLSKRWQWNWGSRKAALSSFVQAAKRSGGPPRSVGSGGKVADQSTVERIARTKSGNPAQRAQRQSAAICEAQPRRNEKRRRSEWPQSVVMGEFTEGCRCPCQRPCQQ